MNGLGPFELDALCDAVERFARLESEMRKLRNSLLRGDPDLLLNAGLAARAHARKLREALAQLDSGVRAMLEHERRQGLKPPPPPSGPKLVKADKAS
jgi:hypothetical protein